MVIKENMFFSGSLNLCTRSLVFEPKDEKLPLIKIKFCDGLIFKTGKFSLTQFYKDFGKKYRFFLKGLNRALKLSSFKSKKHLSKSLNFISLLIKGKKFVIYERSPPSPFTVEILNSYFVFKIEDFKSIN